MLYKKIRIVYFNFIVTLRKTKRDKITLFSHPSPKLHPHSSSYIMVNIFRNIINITFI